MRWYRSRWFFGTCVVLFLGLIGFSAWFFWMANVLAEWRWDEYRATAKRRGVKLSLQELQPDPVQKNQDWSALSLFDPRLPDATTKDLLLRLEKLGKAERVRLKKGEYHFAPPDWAKYRKDLTRLKVKAPADELDDRKWLLAVLVEFDPLLNELLEFRGVGGNWPLAWRSATEEWNSQISILSVVKNLLGMRGLLAVDTEDPIRARACVESLQRLAQSLDKTPGEINGMLRASVENEARAILSFGLDRRVWDAEALRELSSWFLQRNGIQQWRWSLVTQRALTLEQAEQYRSKRDSRLLESISPGGGWMAKIRLKQLRAYWNLQLWTQQFYEEQIGQFDAEREIWNPSRNLQFDPAREIREKTRYALAAQFVSSSLSLARSGLFNHSQNKMAAIACALAWHFEKVGIYPRSLEVLVPDYLPRQPIDPCGGQSFRYRVNPNGTYLLYSIGVDLRDNLGDFGEDRTNYSDDPDWLWLAPARRE